MSAAPFAARWPPSGSSSDFRLEGCKQQDRKSGENKASTADWRCCAGRVPCHCSQFVQSKEATKKQQHSCKLSSGQRLRAHAELMQMYSITSSDMFLLLNAYAVQMGLAWHWARFKDSYMADDDDSCSTSCHHLRVVQAAARQKVRA